MEITIIGLIFLLASWVQGVSGFGSALVALPLLTLCIDIKEAIPLLMLNSLIMTTYLVVQLRKHLSKDKILPLCIGSIPGIIIGVTILKSVPSETIRFLVGLLLISYSLYNFVSKTKPRALHKSWGYLAGFLSGTIGSICSAGGPPTIIYTTMNNWNKDEIKATLTGFFCFTSYLVAIAHAYSGMTTPTVLKYYLFTIPFVFAGTMLGSYCYRFFRREVYIKIIYFSLFVMGILMVM